MDDQTTANDECGICLETLAAAVTLPCTHKFCANCLDGWKSKFSSVYSENKEENKSKLCPLCRERIPPSKDVIIQLEYHRTKKRELEARGDTNSETYWSKLEHIKQLEAEIGDYDGEGLDYDGCMDVPKEIAKAVKKNNMKKVIKWLRSPVDKKRLNSRYPDYMNYTLVHMAIDTANSDLLTILLQYGADVNACDAAGWNSLIIASAKMMNLGHDICVAKILLEWGVEKILPHGLSQIQETTIEEYEGELFVEMLKKQGNNKLANLILSEFGGRRCEVINLPNHPHLNGKTCVIEKYITKKDRYKIIFEGLGNAALVGPNNLKRRDRTPLDCGYYITFKNGKMSRREFATKEECQEYVSSLDISNGDVKSTSEELASMKL